MVEKAAKDFQPKGKTNIPQFTASASALFFLTFSYCSGILFPWEKKMKESQGCTKTAVESTAALWSRSPPLPLFQEPHSLGTIPQPFLHAWDQDTHAYLQRQMSLLAKVATDQELWFFFFFPWKNSPKPERFNQEKLSFGCVFFKCVSSCLTVNRCLLPFLTTLFPKLKRKQSHHRSFCIFKGNLYVQLLSINCTPPDF